MVVVLMLLWGDGVVMVLVGFGGGAVAERGVEAARVVPALDPLEHGPVEPGAGRPPPTASTGAVVAQGARPTVTDPAF